VIGTVIGTVFAFALIVVMPVLVCCYAFRDSPKPITNIHGRMLLDATPVLGAAPAIAYQGAGFSYAAYPPTYVTPSYDDAIPAIFQPDPSQPDPSDGTEVRV
jgi:hypothetical protein